MKRGRLPRMGIGALMLSLLLAPALAAPTMAQEADNLHFITEIRDDGITEEDPTELGQGFDTWWQRHNPDYEAGTYEIVDDPTAPNSAHSLHLGIDSDEADPDSRDQARAMAYVEADGPEDLMNLPGLQEFFDSGLEYTLNLAQATELVDATQLTVDVFFGEVDPATGLPDYASLQLLPGADGNVDVDGQVLTTGEWQTFAWDESTVTLRANADASTSIGTLGEHIADIEAEAGVDATVPPTVIGIGLNVGSDLGATVESYVDQVTVGEDTFKFGPDLRPVLTNWPESAAIGETVTLEGSNLSDATVVVNGGGPVDAVPNADGTELTFVVPEDTPLGDRFVEVSNQYGTVQFILNVVAADAPHPGFDDVPEDFLFHTEILWIAEQGITVGCNPPANDMFCPERDITRGEMAAFMFRALDWEPSDVDGFVDDGHSVFERELNTAKAEDVFRGCNPPTNDRACPDDAITRGEMAAVVVRALELPRVDQDAFGDDDLSVFEGDINALAAADVTRGCNPPVNDMFCPDREITRGEMAAFLYRALHDRVEDPAVDAGNA